MRADNNDYANGAPNFANEPVLHSALRELQATISSSRFWIGFFAVVALLAITGPFGTLDVMGASTRIVYWASIALVTYFTGAAIATTTGIYLNQRNFPDWLTWLLGGLAAGIPVGTITWFMNTLVFDIPIEKYYSFPQFIAYATAIAIVIVILNFLISNNKSPERPAAAKAIPQSPFFKRLPKHLGKTLISLEAQDHYVNVKTTKGNELILMRLTDAQKELETYPGLRTHRSWWVARDAVREIKRHNGKLELVLIDASVVPVSRANAKAVGTFEI